MIDPTVHIPGAVLYWFLARKIFFVYVTPVLLGFLVATLYPIGARAAAKQKSFFAVTLAGALAPSVMLLGWSFVARAIVTAPLYGLGYGLGIAMLSRVHSITLWPRLKIETRQAAFRRITSGQM